MLQEAAALSSLKPQLEQLQVPLFAVVKEDVGTEVQNFRAYFKGEEIFLDEKVGGRSGGSCCSSPSFPATIIINIAVFLMVLISRGVFMGPVSAGWACWVSCGWVFGSAA